MAKQFIVNEKDIINLENDEFEIVSKEVKHIQVLRYDVGDIVVINNKNYEITAMKRKSIIVKYIGKREEKEESNIKINLYMALIKNEMMDLTIKKAVELGVNSITPFFSDNVVVKLNSQSDLIKRKEKFEKITIEAVKQCNSYYIPKINDFISLKNISSMLDNNDINIFAYEKESSSLKENINNIKLKNNDLKNIGIIIGPEGGFSQNEADVLKENSNVYSVSLGKNILRAETAALNLISIVKYEFEKQQNIS